MGVLHMGVRNMSPRRCPKTGRLIGPSPAGRWSRWLFSVAGLVSLLWFVFRVIPKPSRAAYPCQRVAAPVAGGFVLWLSGLAISAYAYSKGKASILRSRWGRAGVFAAIGVVGCFVVVTNLPKPPVKADPLQPIGVAKGIHPGRVVWVWNPGATNWAGPGSGQRYFDNSCTDLSVCERMVSQAVREVSGEDDDVSAWDAIFRSHNIAQGRGNVGYQPGEKIMIKINLSACNAHYDQVDRATYNKLTSILDRIDNSPQLMRALLRQLVENVGVNQSDITIGDSTGLFPNNLRNPVRSLCPNVKFMDNYGGSGRTREEFSSTPFYWSTTEANGKLQDYVTQSFDSATYVVNFAVMKGHSSGVTNCGKNLYGAMLRCPDGYIRDAGYVNYYDMHLSLPNPGWSTGMGKYRAIVDLMGSKQIGAKTVLYLVDGLYAGYYWEGNPYKWQMAPFNNDWPSSIFASQDPVAIDSVAYDFLKTEWPNIVAGAFGSLEGGAEDYLHEAALAGNPPSGTFYDPERDGVRMQSLGVHEHWNNATDKRYSRNLGFGTGIELVRVMEDPGAITRAKQNGNAKTVTVVGAVVSAVFGSYFYVESDDRTAGIRVNKTSHGMSVGRRANVSGILSTDTQGERYIAATTVSDAGNGAVAPLYSAQNRLGGGNWSYDSATGAGQRMVTGGTGLNNIGLLMRISGKVIARDTAASPTWFVVDDGSMPGVGVKCVVESGVTAPALNSFARVTGASSCEKDGDGTILRLVRAVAVN